MLVSTNAASKFCWSDLPSDRPMALLARQRVIGRQAMLSRVALDKGCFVPTFTTTSSSPASCRAGCGSGSALRAARNGVN